MTEVKPERDRDGSHHVKFPDPLPYHLAPRGLGRDALRQAVGRDLIDVAAAVLFADRLVRRPRGGSRRLRLSIPVRQPIRWQRLEPELSAVLSILTDDVFNFRFQATSVPGAAGAEDPPPPPRLERVALFSGGLDSACGAAIFSRRGETGVTAYATQYSTGLERVRDLLAAIGERHDRSSDVHHAAFYLRPRGAFVRRMRENSRRSRSFLFASMGLATAFATGAREVAICENGPLALNLPMSPAMIPTRHAHSQFLHAMSRLAAGLLEGEAPRFVNPFELQTKGEMCLVFSDHPDLALASVSCWYQQWSGRGSRYGQGHCGLCIPCLVRRAALDAAGITVPPDHFDVDVRDPAVRQALERDEPRRLGPYRVVLGFARRIAECPSWQHFLERFPDALDSEPTCDPLSSEDWFSQLFATMRRFADEIEASFRSDGGR